MKVLFSCDHEEENKENFLRELKKIHGENNVKYISDYIPRKSERTILFRIVKHISNFFPENRVLKDLYNNFLKKFYTKKLDEFNTQFDCFFTLAREYSEDFIKTLKNKNPQIITILYLWDSLKLSPYQKDFYKNFDYVFTFDKVDAENYNFIFRPTFYLDDFRCNLINFEEREIDLYYIGNDREKKRVEIVQEFYKVLKKKNIKLFLGLFNKTRGIEVKKEIRLEKKIPYFENMKIIKNSKVVLDIVFREQKGLTLRCFEALATETKIITNNPEIRKYDFYNSQNIFIFEDIEKIKNIPIDFFKDPYKKINEKIVENYSVEKFLNDIFKNIKMKS